MVSKRSLKQTNAYMIIAVVAIFGAIMGFVNYALYDVDPKVSNVKLSDMAVEDPEADFWNDPLGWFGDRIDDLKDAIGNFFTGALGIVTLDIQMLNDMGQLGIVIRAVFTAMLAIGVIDILWIG